MNILILGNQASDPTLHGEGSGYVGVNYVHTPLEAICDEMGVARISTWLPVGRECNSDSGNCVTYIGIPKTNGKTLFS
jgi:hypothetical protein